MRKLYFRSTSPCITYLFLFFTGRTNVQKLQTGTYTERLPGPVMERPRDQMMGRSRDGTSAGRRSNMFFKFKSQTH